MLPRFQDFLVLFTAVFIACLVPIRCVKLGFVQPHHPFDLADEYSSPNFQVPN